MTVNFEVSSINESLVKARDWLTQFQEASGASSLDTAYSGLRAGLHTLRDRLVEEEAVHLASHMPMLIRGIYYEGWRPSLAPNRERTVEQFRDSLLESLGPSPNAELDPDAVLRATCQTVSEMCDAGEAEQVRHALPLELREAYWPEPVRQ